MDNLCIISVSDAISIFRDIYGKEAIASLPPFPKKSYADETVNHIGRQQQSDVIVDSSHNVYYAFYHPLMIGSDSFLYIYFFDQQKKQWRTYTLETDGGDIRRLRIFVRREDLYVGIWYYPDRFHVKKCRLTSSQFD
jgi:hypothetical protein